MMENLPNFGEPQDPEEFFPPELLGATPSGIERVQTSGFDKIAKNLERIANVLEKGIHITIDHGHIEHIDHVDHVDAIDNIQHGDIDTHPRNF